MTNKTEMSEVLIDLLAQRKRVSDILMQAYEELETALLAGSKMSVKARQARDRFIKAQSAMLEAQSVVAVYIGQQQGLRGESMEGHETAIWLPK